MYTLAGTLDTPTAPPFTAPTAAAAGDNGPASSATFGGAVYNPSQGSNSASGPTGFFLDGGGNIYVADFSSNTIRLIYEGDPVPPVFATEGITPTKGYIYTIAGNYTVGSVDSLNDCASFTSIQCGDGGPATSAFLYNPASVYVDAQGNVFIADEFDNTIRVVYVSGSLPGISNPVPGDIYTIAGNAAGMGTFANNCTTSIPNCGDAGPALSAFLNGPVYVTGDPGGNLYISDSLDETVRVVYASGNIPGVPNLTSADLGNIYTVAGTIAGAGASPPANNCDINQSPIQCGDGRPASQAQLYTPAGLAFDSFNNLYIADSNDSAVREVVGIPPAKPQTITFPQIPDQIYGATVALPQNASSGLPISYTSTGPASISGDTLTFTGIGAISITATQPGGTIGDQAYLPATPVTNSFNVSPATLTVTANRPEGPTIGFGSPVPDVTNDYAITGFAYSDTQATATTGKPLVQLVPAYTTKTPIGTQLTLQVSAGTLVPNANYTRSFSLVNEIIIVTGSAPQSITFPPIPTQPYGTVIALPVAASSGLPISYTLAPGSPAKLSGTTLTVTGSSGTVSITALQGGNNTYAPATPVTQTFKVIQATLTVTADNQNTVVGAPIPSLSYTLTGFLVGDTQANATTGAPLLSTDATPSSGVGTYAISISQGTLAAKNYTFHFVPGILTIAEPTAQTISFAPLPANVTYGIGAIPLSATSSSGLPVTFTVTGPAVLTGSSILIGAAGQVSVTASQAGNNVFGPAPPITQQISVTPAILTVTANSFTRPLFTNDPPYTYTVTGFVNGDTGAILSGMPMFTPSDTLLSPAGTYPLLIGQPIQDPAQPPVTPLYAGPNYTFNFVAGTVTVLPGPAPDFSITANPTSITISPGQIAQASILVTPINGYVNEYNSKTNPVELR